MWSKRNNNNQRFNGPPVRDFLNGNFQNFNQNSWSNFNGNSSQNFNGNPRQNFNGNPRQNFNGNPRQNFNGNPRQNFNGNLRQNFNGSFRQNFPNNNNNFQRPPYMNGKNAYRQPTPNLLHLLQTPSNNSRNVIASYLPQYKNSANKNKKANQTKAASNDFISQTENQQSTTIINKSHSSPKLTSNESLSDHTDKEDKIVKADSNLSEIPNVSTAAESLNHSSNSIKDNPSITSLNSESAIEKEGANLSIAPSQNPLSNNASTSPEQNDQLCPSTNKDYTICSTASIVAEKGLIVGDSTNILTVHAELSSTTTQSKSKPPTDEIYNTTTGIIIPSNNLTNDLDSLNFIETFDCVSNSSNITSKSTSSICTEVSDNSSCPSKESKALDISEPLLSVLSIANSSAPQIDKINVIVPLSPETSTVTNPCTINLIEASKSSSYKDADTNEASSDSVDILDNSPNSMQSSKSVVTESKFYQISDNNLASKDVDKNSTESLKSSIVNKEDPIKGSTTLSVPPDKSTNSLPQLKGILIKSSLNPSTNTSTSTAPSTTDNALDSEGNVNETFTVNSTETTKSSFPNDDDSNKDIGNLTVLPDKSSTLSTSDHTSIFEDSNVATLTKNSKDTIESSLVKTDNPFLLLDKRENCGLQSKNIVTKSTLNSTNTSTVEALSTPVNSSIFEGNSMGNFPKTSTESSVSIFDKDNDQNNVSTDSSVFPDKNPDNSLSSKTVLKNSALDPSTPASIGKGPTTTDNTSSSFAKIALETLKSGDEKSDNPNNVTDDLSVSPDGSSNISLSSKIIITKSALLCTLSTSTSTALSTSNKITDSEGNVIEPSTKNSTKTLNSSSTESSVPKKVSNNLSTLANKSINSALPSCITVTKSALYPLEDKEINDKSMSKNKRNKKKRKNKSKTTTDKTLISEEDFTQNVYSIIFDDDENTLESGNENKNNESTLSRDILTPTRLKQSTSCNQISELMNPANQTEKSEENLNVINSNVAISSACPDSSASMLLSLDSSITDSCLSPAAALVHDSSISTSSNEKESILDSVVKNYLPSLGSKEMSIKNGETSFGPKKTEGKSGFVSKGLGKFKAKSILRSKLFQDKLLNQKNRTETENSAEVQSIDFKKRILKSKNLLNELFEKNKITKTEDLAIVDKENPDQDSGEYYGCAPPGQSALEIITPFQKEKKKNLKNKEITNNILAMINKITDPSKSISKEKNIGPNRSEENKKSNEKDLSHLKKKSSSSVRSRSKSPAKNTGHNSKSYYSRRKSKSRSRSNSRSKSPSKKTGSRSKSSNSRKKTKSRSRSNSRSKSSSKKSSIRRSRRSSRSRSRSRSRTKSYSPKSRRFNKNTSHSPNKSDAYSSRKRHRSKGTYSDDNKNNGRSQRRKQDRSKKREKSPRNVCGVQILTKDPVKHDILEAQILRIDSLFMHGNDRNITDKIEEGDDNSTQVTEKNKDSRIDVYDSENEVDPWEVMGYSWKTVGTESESESDDEKDTKEKGSKKSNGYEEPLKPMYDKNGSLTNRDAIIRDTEKRTSHSDNKRKRRSSENSEDSTGGTKKSKSNYDTERSRKSSERSRKSSERSRKSSERSRKSSERSKDSISDTEKRSNSDAEKKSRSSDKNEDCMSDTERRKSRHDSEKITNSSDESENDELGEYKVRNKSVESRSSSSSERTIDLSTDSEEDNKQKEKSMKNKKSKCKRNRSTSSDSDSETKEVNDKSTSKKKKAKKKRKRKSKKSEKNKRSKKTASKNENKSKTSPSYPSSDEETIVMNKGKTQDINRTEVPERLKYLSEYNDIIQRQQDSQEDYERKPDQNFETEPSTSCDMPVNDAMKKYLENMNNNKENDELKRNSDIHFTSTNKDNFERTSSELQKEEEQIQESVDEIFNQWQSKKKHMELEQEVVELRKRLKLMEDRVQGKFAVEKAMNKFAVENAMQQHHSYEEGSPARISQRRYVDTSREDQMKRDVNYRQLGEETNVNIYTQPEENKKLQENVWGAAYVSEVEKDMINEKSKSNGLATGLVNKPNENYEYHEKNTNLQQSHLSISTDRSYHENIVHEYEGETRLLEDERKIRNSSSVNKMENSMFGEQLDIMLRDARLNSTEQYDSSNTNLGVYVQPTEIPKRMDPRMTEYNEDIITNVYNDASSPVIPDANEMGTNNGNGNNPNERIRSSTTGVNSVNPVADQRNVLTKSVDPRLYNKGLYENQEISDFAKANPVDPRLNNKSLYLNCREDIISKESRVDRTKNWVTEHKTVNIERKTLKYDRNIQQMFCNDIVNELENETVIGLQTELKDNFEIQPVKDKTNRPYEKIPGIKYKKKDQKVIETNSRKIEHNNQGKIDNITMHEKEDECKKKGQNDKTIKINANDLEKNANTSDEIDKSNKTYLLSTTQDSNISNNNNREAMFRNNHLLAAKKNSGEHKVSMNKNTNVDSGYHINRVSCATSILSTARRKDKSSTNVIEKNIEKPLPTEQRSGKEFSCSSESTFKIKRCNSERDSANISLLIDALPLKTPENQNHVENSHNKVNNIAKDNRYNTDNHNSLGKSQNKDITTPEEKSCNINTNSRYLCSLKSLKSVPLQTSEKFDSVDKSQNKGKSISEGNVNYSNTNPHDIVASVKTLPLLTTVGINSNTNPQDIVPSVKTLPLQTTENINSIKKSKNKRNFTKSLQMRNLQREKEHKENSKQVANEVSLDEEKYISMQKITQGHNGNVTTVNLDVAVANSSEYGNESDVSNVYTTKNQRTIEDESLLSVDKNRIASSTITEKRLMDHKKQHINSITSEGDLRKDKNSKRSAEKTTILLKKSYRRIGVVKLYHLANFCPNCLSELIPDINTRVKLSTRTLILKCQVCYQEIMMIGVVAPSAISKKVEPSRKITTHSNSPNDLSNKGTESSYVINTHNDQILTQLGNKTDYAQKETVHEELKSKSKTKLKSVKSLKRLSNKKYSNVIIVENPNNTFVEKKEKPNKPKICKYRKNVKKSRKKMNENSDLHNKKQNPDIMDVISISNRPTKIKWRVIVNAVNDENVKKVVEIMGQKQKTKRKAKSKKLNASKIKNLASQITTKLYESPEKR